MPDPQSLWAERLIADADILSASEAARLIVEHYRVAKTDGQLAIVLALISKVLALRGRLRQSMQRSNHAD